VETRRCWKLKEKSLDHTLWRTCFGKLCRLVRQKQDDEGVYDWLDIIIETESVYWAVRTECLNPLRLMQCRQKRPTGAVFLDVAKDFDIVWVDGLLYKLPILNYPSYLVKTVSSYLCSRTFEASFEQCPCHGSGGVSRRPLTAVYRFDPGSVRVSFAVDEGKWGRFLSECFGFCLATIIPPVLFTDIYVPLPEGRAGEVRVPSKKQCFFSKMVKHWIDKDF
jgi:hypothetical protein